MKRFLTGALAALLSFSTLAATLNPISLLNPAGSTSGQAILSTGPSTPPAWSSVTLDGIGGFNTTGFVYRNSANSYVIITPPIIQGVGGTGLSTLAAHQVVVGGAGNAMTPITPGAAGTIFSSNGPTVDPSYRTAASLGLAATASPLSQFAATTSAQLAGVISDETGTGPAVFGTSPTITTPNVVGTAGIAAASGSVGQHQNLGNAVGTVSLPSSAATNCFSTSLTAGSYQITGVANIAAGGSNTMTFPTAGISTTSVTLGAFGSFAQIGATFPAGASLYMTLPTVYFDLTTTTTVYVVGNATNTGAGTCAANISVLRIH